VSFIAGLVSTFHYHLILTSTAFIGATAFILGIDCFTRAGLKEFYVYNLGFRNGLFPKLWVQEEGSVGEWKFPLLTIMQVEIGMLIAVFLVGPSPSLIKRRDTNCNIDRSVPPFNTEC
jgi:hypothetical protein